MSTKYSREIETAFKLIKSRGTNITVNRYTQGIDYDPVVGDASSDVLTTTSIQGVILPPKSSSSFDAEFNTEILKGRMRMVLCSPSGADFELDIGDILEFENTEWQITGHVKIAPDGGAAIIQKLLVKRS